MFVSVSFVYFATTTTLLFFLPFSALNKPVCFDPDQDTVHISHTLSTFGFLRIAVCENVHEFMIVLHRVFMSSFPLFHIELLF